MNVLYHVFQKHVSITDGFAHKKNCLFISNSPTLTIINLPSWVENLIIILFSVPISQLSVSDFSHLQYHVVIMC